MNEYKIIIVRNGQTVHEQEADADQVIDFILSQRALEQTVTIAVPVLEAKEKVAAYPRSTKAKGGCDECGSTTRHKSTCSRARSTGIKPSLTMTGTPEWQALGGVSSPSKKISRMHFGRVKISQSHDIPADTIARNLDETVDEIEKAIDAETYDEYLKL